MNDDQPPATYLEPFKNPPHGMHPFARFRWNLVAAQDAAAWEAGDRRRSRTRAAGHPDRGIVLLRQVMREQIERVQQGLDSLGVERTRRT